MLLSSRPSLTDEWVSNLTLPSEASVRAGPMLMCLSLQIARWDEQREAGKFPSDLSP